MTAKGVGLVNRLTKDGYSTQERPSHVDVLRREFNQPTIIASYELYTDGVFRLGHVLRSNTQIMVEVDNWPGFLATLESEYGK